MTGNQKLTSFAWRLLWYLAGLILTLAGIMVMALNKPDGLRGERVVMSYADVREYDTSVDAIIVGVFAAIVALLTCFRSRLGMKSAFLFGQWVALAVAMVIMLIR